MEVGAGKDHISPLKLRSVCVTCQSVLQQEAGRNTGPLSIQKVHTLKNTKNEPSFDESEALPCTAALSPFDKSEAVPAPRPFNA